MNQVTVPKRCPYITRNEDKNTTTIDRKYVHDWQLTEIDERNANTNIHERSFFMFIKDVEAAAEQVVVENDQYPTFNADEVIDVQVVN
jgi:hypothetical protein